ncbi:MAG: esterase [Rhodospirillaceae bacterium]|jgi:arylformamidase|nr:esterase [Rhodospirillaceae bacterium]|tara:strand:+ start:801 stop:1700 length:900 start_codon:yes stop_codon:yes gene_type:complete
MMPDTTSDIVYQGYTAEQLSANMAVHKSVENLGAYMKESAELAAEARTKVSGVFDIAYGVGDLQKLDIYAPEGASGGNGRAPVLIDIHGGGWTQGTKQTRSLPAPAIVGRGVIWVPIDYGLAPGHGMAEIVDHIRQAVAWVHGNIADFGGDAERLFVSGNSAGGHLTGTTVMPGWHDRYGIPEDAVKGACALSGVFDLEALVRAAKGPNEALNMDLETAHALSPIRHLPAAAGPLIIGYGEPELDEFKRQSSSFAAAWADAGLDVTEIQVPGAHHFAMSRQLADASGELHQAVMDMIGV